jgi:hypothetical protein
MTIVNGLVRTEYKIEGTFSPPCHVIDQTNGVAKLFLHPLHNLIPELRSTEKDFYKLEVKGKKITLPICINPTDPNDGSYLIGSVKVHFIMLDQEILKVTEIDDNSKTNVFL